jgi:hypothetical protein
MFNDASFAPVKGKTNELYSCLFHRRYAKPDLAFSETTAFPADQLSAPNMAAKLAVSTIADVRNTMYMSGITPFPVSHWDTLAPAMKKHVAIHERLAGHKPAGPFKHYWGEASRYIGDDNPYSLFLATGVPFEVVDEPGADGWTFLSEWEARDAAEGTLASPGTTFITRQAPASATPNLRAIPEELPALFDFKRSIAEHLRDTPHILEDEPVVCAWYPTASAVLLWNLSDTWKDLTVAFAETRMPVGIGPLGLDILELPG